MYRGSGGRGCKREATSFELDGWPEFESTSLKCAALARSDRRLVDFAKPDEAGAARLGSGGSPPSLGGFACDSRNGFPVAVCLVRFRTERGVASGLLDEANLGLCVFSAGDGGG